MPGKTIQPFTYLKAFLALLVLLALTVGASSLKLGSFSIVVSLTISIAKALLIILIFMEVRSSRPIIWLFAAAGFVWLTIMLLLLFSDYSTRHWIGPDWRAGVNGSNHVEFASPPR